MNENIVISGKKNGYLRKLLIHFFIAGLVGWLISLFGEIVDSVIAGTSISEEALAAVEIVIPFYTLIFFVANLLALGTGIKYSHAVGEGDLVKANKIFTQSFFVSIGLGLVVAAIMFFGKEQFLQFFCEGQVLEYARKYYDPYIFVAIIYPVFYLIYQIVSVDGDFKLILVYDVAQPVINLGLSLLLVKIFMPGDIFGLGIATMSSTAIGAIIVCLHFFKKSNTVKIRPYFNFKELINTIMICISTWLNILFIAVLDLIMNYVITSRFKDMSTGYLNVYSIINFTINFAEILCACGEAGSLIWAIAKGEENNLDMKNTTKIVRKMNFFTIIGITIMFASFCWFWPILYGIDEQPFVHLSIISGLVISLFNSFTGFTHTYSFYYISQDKIFPSMLNGFLNMLLFPLIIGIPLSYVCGFYGFIIGFSLSPLLTWLILLFYIYKKYGKINFPFYLPKCQEEQYCFNLEIDPQSIGKLRDQVEIILNNHKIDKKLINRILVTIEEAYMMIYEKNNNQKGKLPLSTLFLGFKDDEIRLIEKDDGIIFELANKDQQITDLRTHVFLQTLNISKSIKNTITVATNINTFVFNKSFNV